MFSRQNAWNHWRSLLRLTGSCTGLWLASSAISLPVRASSAAAPSALPPVVLRLRLQSLPDWQQQDQQLITTCEFADFVDTVGFVNQLVEPAERLGHHPDLQIRYSRLEISLTTHDAGGLSELDLALAEVISTLAAGRCGKTRLP